MAAPDSTRNPFPNFLRVTVESNNRPADPFLGRIHDACLDMVRDRLAHAFGPAPSPAPSEAPRPLGSPEVLLQALAAKYPRPILFMCDFCDEYCDCRDKATVHLIETEEDLCVRHFNTRIAESRQGAI